MGKDQLTGYSLGNLTANVVGQSVLIGLLSALDTLAPSEIGRGRPEMVGVLCVRACVVCLVSFIPFAILWLFYVRRR